MNGLRSALHFFRFLWRNGQTLLMMVDLSKWRISFSFSSGMLRHLEGRPWQLRDHLLHEVLRKWIDIRGNMFAKTFTLVFKQKFIICLMIKRIDNLNQQNQTWQKHTALEPNNDLLEIWISDFVLPRYYNCLNNIIPLHVDGLIFTPGWNSHWKQEYLKTSIEIKNTICNICICHDL